MAALEDEPFEIPRRAPSQSPRRRIRRPSARPLGPEVSELLRALAEMRRLERERRQPGTSTSRFEELGESIAERSRQVFRIAGGARPNLTLLQGGLDDEVGSRRSEAG